MSAFAVGAVKFAKFDISTATQTVVANAAGNKCITVIHACFSFSGAATMKFNDSSVDMTGLFDLAGVYAFCGSREAPLFSTAIANSLRITTTGTPSLRGFIAYMETDS